MGLDHYTRIPYSNVALISSFKQEQELAFPDREEAYRIHCSEVKEEACITYLPWDKTLDKSSLRRVYSGSWLKGTGSQGGSRGAGLGVMAGHAISAGRKAGWCSPLSSPGP